MFNLKEKSNKRFITASSIEKNIALALRKAKIPKGSQNP